MDFAQLPLATQLLLDPQAELPSDTLAAWTAACGAYADGAADSRDAARASAAVVARLSGTAAARRGPKRLMDTHDFFALSEALDTLTGELKAAATCEATTLQTSSAAAPKSAAARYGPGDFDPRRDPMQSAAQQADVRDATTAYFEGQYKIALECLLHASSLCMAHELSSSLLHNIAVCYYKLELWELCASATQRVLSIDTTGVYASQQRLVRVCIAQGNVDGAQRMLAGHRDVPHWREEVSAVKAFSAYTTFYATHQYAKARASLEALLLLMPCGTLEAAKARLLSLDNATVAAHYAQEKAELYTFSNEMHLAAWELAFHAATSAGDLTALQAAMQHATTGTGELRFRLLQSHVTRCRDAVHKLDALAADGAWADVVAYASQMLAEAFISDGVKSIIYHSRAAARVRQGTSWYEALDDAHRALSYTEAPELRALLLLLVAQCEEALGRWQDAVEHAEESAALQGSTATETYVKQLRERRARAQKKAQTPSPKHKQSQQQQHASSSSSGGSSKKQQQQQQQNVKTALDVHYQTLSLASGAGAVEVRKSYRAMAMRWHPDRWCGGTAEEIRTAEDRFKGIQDAYEKLMQSFT